MATIVDVGSDPHSYEPVPSDARLLSGADLVIRNGLGLEGWLDRLIQTSASHVPVVTVTDGVPRRQLIQNDPHLWMDPTLARAYASAIRDALIATDPRHAMQYEASAAAFLAELDALDTFIGEAMSRLPDERRKLVTTHDAFAYLGRRYGLEVVGTIWGITTEREPSAQEVRRLVDEVRAQRVPVVFVETTVNPSLMKAVARDAGVTVGQALYGDSVGPVGGEASSYLGMMRANARTIVKGLAGDDADPAG